METLSPHHLGLLAAAKAGLRSGWPSAAERALQHHEALLKGLCPASLGWRRFVRVYRAVVAGAAQIAPDCIVEAVWDGGRRVGYRVSCTSATTVQELLRVYRRALGQVA